MDRVRVLIVDDHSIVREGICALISTDEKIEVVGEATNGREAVERAVQLSPDIIIMDISMPVMDGLEATRRIRRNDPDVKVVILTQHNNPQHTMASVRAGADGLIPKEAVSTDLITAIHTVCQGQSYLYPTMASMVLDNLREQTSQHGEDEDGLTDREKEIVKLIAEDHSCGEIAEMLYLSVNTVLNHRKNIMKKLHIRHPNGIVKYAIRKGLIDV